MAHLNPRSQEIKSIFAPVPEAVWESDFFWKWIERSLEDFGVDYGGLELNPDFQRGHVWTLTQQKSFIYNCLRRVVSSSAFIVQFNCPNYKTFSSVNTNSDLPMGFQCIDGLQRLTAITSFMRNEFDVHGFKASDLLLSPASPGDLRVRLAVHNFQTRAEVLNYYLDFNRGGVAHSPAEIARVEQLLAAAKA